MIDAEMEHAFEVAAADDQQSRHSRRTLPTQRSRCALAFGACTGVRMTLIVSLAKSAPKAAGNFASQSWIRKRAFPSVCSIARFRACCVTQAQSGLAVTLARWTRREPCSIQTSTYSVRSQAVSTVKKM